jgi:hypothetical protein
MLTTARGHSNQMKLITNQSTTHLLCTALHSKLTSIWILNSLWSKMLLLCRRSKQKDRIHRKKLITESHNKKRSRTSMTPLSVLFHPTSNHRWLRILQKRCLLISIVWSWAASQAKNKYSLPNPYSSYVAKRTVLISLRQSTDSSMTEWTTSWVTFLPRSSRGPKLQPSSKSPLVWDLLN